MDDLTKSEKEVFIALYEYIEEHKFSPTVREIGQMTNRRSPASVHRLLKSLKDKEYINYVYNHNRTITILKEMDDGEINE